MKFLVFLLFVSSPALAQMSRTTIDTVFGTAHSKEQSIAAYVVYKVYSYHKKMPCFQELEQNENGVYYSCSTLHYGAEQRDSTILAINAWRTRRPLPNSYTLFSHAGGILDLSKDLRVILFRRD